MLKLVRDPFIQFLAAGAVLYAVFALTAAEEPEQYDRQIILDAATLDWIHSNFVKQMRRPPTPTEMDTLVRTHVEHEVKYREAVAMDLDDGDSIVQRRMVQKFDFLFGGGAAEADPGDEVLGDWYEAHRNQFAIPGAVTFEHVWFSPDERGERASDDAAAAAEALNAGNAVEADIFPFQDRFTDAPTTRIRSVFGEAFVTALFEVPIDEWFGPVSSGLGAHAVRVSARTPGNAPSLEEVRDAVLDEWRRMRNREILEQMTAELLESYSVSIDEDALDLFEFTPEPGGTAP